MSCERAQSGNPLYGSYVGTMRKRNRRSSTNILEQNFNSCQIKRGHVVRGAAGEASPK